MNRGPIAKAGNTIRKIARNSIRRRTYRTKPNPPGLPPFSRRNKNASGNATVTPPFKMIYSIPNRMGTSAVIGMVGFTNITNPVPGLHEHGGRARRKYISKRTWMGPRPRDPLGRYQKRRLIFAQKRVRYPRRPFMNPALRKAAASGKLSRYWRGSLLKGSF